MLAKSLRTMMTTAADFLLQKKYTPDNPDLWASVVKDAKDRFAWPPSIVGETWLVNQYRKRGGNSKRDGVVTKSLPLPAGTVIEVSKADAEQRLVFGFAKMAEDPNSRGNYYVDRQGDIIETAALEKAAYDYVLNYRDGGEMHETAGASTLVESFMVTPEKLEKMGLAKDALPYGWWVGFKVHPVEKGATDPWDKIKNGEYTAFSIEGMGRRVPVGKADPTAGSVHSDAPCNCNRADCTAGCVSKSELQHGMETSFDKEMARRSIRDMARNNTITSQEADQMLRNLVDIPNSEVDAPAGEEDGRDLVADILGRMANFGGVKKHKGNDHPESSHGNRLFSAEAEAVGDLMKKLKTRFKRTDADTLQNLRQKFSQASGDKATLSHDQVVAELARRNVIPTSSINFRSGKFKDFKDEIMAAITAELKDS